MTKELNTGEPVAYRSRWKNRKGEFITGWVVCNGAPYLPDERQEIDLLHSQNYVNQLLGEIESLKEKMCQAIYEEAAYCYDNGDYMLDYSDCQSVIRGTWKRPAYNGESNER